MIQDSKNKALNSVLQHYIGDSIMNVSEYNDGFIFRTGIGKTGSLDRSPINEEWRITVDGEIIDFIEPEVFSALIDIGSNYTLDQYSLILHDLVGSDTIKYRSKSLVSKLLMVLEDYMLNSEEFVPRVPIQIGVNYIFPHNGIRFMYCLN